MRAKLPRRVVFVGGVADGQWHEVTADQTLYRFPLPLAPIDITRDVPSTASFRTHDYQIEKFAMFGRTLWVGLFTELYGRDRENATMRTLFQRDVAEQLTRGQ